MILGLCLAAATAYGLGSGRARLKTIPARPTDRAFLVRTWGELVRIPELPTLVIDARPFVMELHAAPTYPEPRLRVTRRVVADFRPERPEPPPTALEPAGPVMARFAPAPEPAETPESSLPDAPDPSELRPVVASLRGRAERCYEATMVPGRVELLLTVEGATGTVREARASGAGAIARCIEEAASALRFPIFARASIRIQQTYTFR